jgi:hypothetical protein
MTETTVDRAVSPAPPIKDPHVRLRGVAETVFPTGTRLVALPGEGDLVLLVSWKLGTDPARPNKRSRTVRISVSQEALEDYRGGQEGQREYADQRLASFLHKGLAQLDPTHDAPLGTEAPIEKWQVGTIELNG